MGKPILFLGWHKTLSEQKFWEDEVSVEHLRFIDRELFMHNEMLRRWMRGAYSSAEICHWLSMSTGIDGPDLFAALQKSCERFEISKELQELLRKVKERSEIVLITDNMDCFSKWVVPKIKALDLFSEIIVSCEMGKRKEDDHGSIFQEVLTRRNTEASNAWLIDDGKNICDAFAKMGGKALLASSVKETQEILQQFSFER